MAQAGFFDVIRRAIGWKASVTVTAEPIETFVAHTRTFGRVAETRTFHRVAKTRVFDRLAKERGDD